MVLLVVGISSTVSPNVFSGLKVKIRLLSSPFLAVKRSSTRALVPLSVRLSVRLKTEFLTVWLAYDS